MGEKKRRRKRSCFMSEMANLHIYITPSQKKWVLAERKELGFKSGALLFDRMRQGYILAKALVKKQTEPKGQANVF